MATFSKMGVWPIGYFRAASAWLLRERRDVALRVAVISAELNRIGFVRVIYGTTQEGDSVKASEERIGFSVTRGSSLARLVQAYIANGGNPFDICGFLHPDQTLVKVSPEGEMAFVQTYPGGGVVAPKSANYNEPLPELVTTDDGGTDAEKSGYEDYEGGYPNSDRFYPARMGGRLNRGAWDNNTVVRVMHEMRGWANQTIRERLQDMEWRIIKLSDLHEQLSHERDYVLVQAFGGTLDGLAPLDENQFDKGLMVQSLIADMYALVFETGEGGFPVGFTPTPNIGFLQFTFEDKTSEAAGGL